MTKKGPSALRKAAETLERMTRTSRQNRSKCRKRSFESKKDADSKIKDVGRLGSKKKSPLHSYRCDLCGAWHVGHKSQRVA